MASAGPSCVVMSLHWIGCQHLITRGGGDLEFFELVTLTWSACCLSVWSPHSAIVGLL